MSPDAILSCSEDKSASTDHESCLELIKLRAIKMQLLSSFCIQHGKPTLSLIDPLFESQSDTWKVWTSKTTRLVYVCPCQDPGGMMSVF